MIKGETYDEVKLHKLIKGATYTGGNIDASLIKMTEPELHAKVKDCLVQGGDIGHHIDGDSALHSAVYKEDIVLVQMLLEYCNCAGIDEKNERGLTPFSIAINV